MTYYFDVTEKFVKTIAVEADSLEQAEEKIDIAWNKGEFTINHNHPDGVEFNWVQEEVEACIKEGYYAKEELETLK